MALSIALPIEGVDPFCQLSLLDEDKQFRFLWDEAPGLCFVASGRCQHFEMNGPRRFELAQRFSDESLGRLIDLTPKAPKHSLPRTLFAFSFFEQTSDKSLSLGSPPSVQAVLPKWQLSVKGIHSWLRLNAVISTESQQRQFVEEIWCMKEKLLETCNINRIYLQKNNYLVSTSQSWENHYLPALMRGIDLVNSGDLKKLVLAVRQTISFKCQVDPLPILYSLRKNYKNSCRFLWQGINKEAFFGASPERLLSLNQGQIQIDALAGTAPKNGNGQSLLTSEKDLREHHYVVSSIISKLSSHGLKPFHFKHPKLAKYGELIHLHTPIIASAIGHKPLSLASFLHPTPAVAGLPRRHAMTWLRTLEPFERGYYAAPIGWIDSFGNSELRVAIRCGYIKGNQLELTAGAGLVRGSLPEKELQEVALKLGVLADQINLQPNFFNRRSIT